MPNAIKEGDVVLLKSGGPKITVGPAMSNGGFMCHWFYNFEVRKEVFSPEQLKLAEEEHIRR